MSSKTRVTQDETMAEPVFVTEGEEPVYSINVPGVQTSITNDSTLTMAIYKANSRTDLSATYLSGSMSLSSALGPIVTKKFVSLKAGTYVWRVMATVDGILRQVVKVPFIVLRADQG